MELWKIIFLLVWFLLIGSASTVSRLATGSWIPVIIIVIFAYLWTGFLIGIIVCRGIWRLIITWLPEIISDRFQSWMES